MTIDKDFLEDLFTNSDDHYLVVVHPNDEEKLPYFMGNGDIHNLAGTLAVLMDENEAIKQTIELAMQSYNILYKTRMEAN